MPTWSSSQASSYKTALSSLSRNANANTMKKKRPAPSSNNSAQSALVKRPRGNSKIALPPVGSLLYKSYGTTVNGGPIGDAIYGVLHHRGTTAIAQEMRVVGKNAGIITNNVRAINLIPHGLNPSGETIAVHAVARGVWHDANHIEYRQLLHGQTVENAVDVNARKLNTLKKKVAARKIQAAWKKYQNFSRSVVQNPLVKAALTSSKYMIHLSAHGTIVPRVTFVVPRNVVIVFTAPPGVPTLAYTTRTISMNRVRKMILGRNSIYTAAYFEGDRVSEHMFEFSERYSGLFQILPENVELTRYMTTNRYEPRSLNIRHTAWRKAGPVNSEKCLSDRRYLSDIVKYLSGVHARQKPREPLILVVHACRDCHSSNTNLGGHVARNVAARRRVSGPGYTLPSDLQNLKRMGMTPYLKNMYYREMQNNEMKEQWKSTATYVGLLRDAGLLNKKFNKATAGRQ